MVVLRGFYVVVGGCQSFPSVFFFRVFYVVSRVSWVVTRNFWAVLGDCQVVVYRPESVPTHKSL